MANDNQNKQSADQKNEKGQEVQKQSAPGKENAAGSGASGTSNQKQATPDAKPVQK